MVVECQVPPRYAERDVRAALEQAGRKPGCYTLTLVANSRQQPIGRNLGKMGPAGYGKPRFQMPQTNSPPVSLLGLRQWGIPSLMVIRRTTPESQFVRGPHRTRKCQLHAPHVENREIE